MNTKKTKILIGVLVTGIVLIGGWWIWKEYSTLKSYIPPSSSTPILKQLTITTDKTEYEQGEMVNITIKNNQSKEIRFEIGFIEPFTSLFIEKYENGKWREFSEVYGSAEITPDFTPHSFLKDSKKLGPTEELNYKFELWHRQEYNEGYTTGRYRIKLNYYYFNEISQNTNWDEFYNLQHTIYSNEFTIKEK